MFDPLSNQLLIITLLALLAVALQSDIQERRIPNQLVVTGLLLGVAGHVWLAGIGGLTIAVSGALVGLLCLLPFYISGGLGAGDVKLMAMCGAFLGPLQVVAASVASLLVGGAIGVAWFFWQFSAGGEDDVKDHRQSVLIPMSHYHVTTSSAIPYALAIAGGVLISLKTAPMILLILNGGISS